VIAVGWNVLGNLAGLNTLHAIKARLKECYPEASEGKINNHAGQLYRFLCEFSIGDHVISYNPENRTYIVGTITSDYEFETQVIEYFHLRKVNWFKELSRDDLSTRTKNSLGSTMTIFKIPPAAEQEILQEGPGNEGKNQGPAADPDDTLDTLKDDFEEKAHEFIKDELVKLEWEEMEEFVAGVLRAMGYKTLVGAKGPDGGKDILASPDGLGLEDPKIKVEVKHRKKVAMGAPEIRNLLGGLRPGDRALYVSTGGFTREARYEADRANVPLTLVDADLLVKLIIQNYDRFDPDTRAMLPLKKIYWPI
jgi:Uncharacterized conserved protein